MLGFLLFCHVLKGTVLFFSEDSLYIFVSNNEKTNPMKRAAIPVIIASMNSLIIIDGCVRWLTSETMNPEMKNRTCLFFI